MKNAPAISPTETAGRRVLPCFNTRLGLAEILNKHIAEQRTLFDGVVEGDVGMGMRVEPMFGHAAFSAFAIVRFQQGHGAGFDIDGGDAEGAFADEADQIPVYE